MENRLSGALNETLVKEIMSNGTDSVPKRHVTLAALIVLTMVYVTGVFGNIWALIILYHKDKRRNRKHLLMLRCLATNDLVALLGMLVQMYVTIYAGHVTSTKALCTLRVVWRLFGLFSGCVAIVMAVERWLALTRPFVYQKQVTFPVIVRCMLLLWLAAFLVTSLPLAGFGLYFKDEQCVRYRNAEEPKDIAYAYIWFLLGTTLCLSIVYCNLAVFRALRRLNRRNGALRRISRASTKAKPFLTMHGPSADVRMTPEERAFSRLMAVLSISYVIFWMPQMISIPLAQYAMTLPATAVVTQKIIRGFHIIADILLCVHFTMDPYIYVLLHMTRPQFSILKPLCRICWPGSSHSDSFEGSQLSSVKQRTDHISSGDSPTPMTEAPSTPVSEECETRLTLMPV